MPPAPTACVQRLALLGCSSCCCWGPSCCMCVCVMSSVTVVQMVAGDPTIVQQPIKHAISRWYCLPYTSLYTTKMCHMLVPAQINDALRSHKRYMHYFERYKQHLDSLTKEKNNRCGAGDLAHTVVSSSWRLSAGMQHHQEQ